MDFFTVHWLGYLTMSSIILIFLFRHWIGAWITTHYTKNVWLVCHYALIALLLMEYLYTISVFLKQAHWGRRLEIEKKVRVR